MLRAFGVALMATAFLSSPPVSPGNPVPGGPDPNAARVWSVWQSDGTAWLAATPADVPKDGAVIGWRFSVAADGSAAESPGGDQPAFDQVCGKQAAASGQKRVAVQVDFGDAASDAYPGDTPPAQGLLKCVSGAENASAAQLLALAADAKVNPQGEVVAVDDYPAKEKGGAAPTPAAGGSQGGGLPLTWILGGAGALVLVAGGAVVATRRRAKAPVRSGG